jgi:hypothetical protein
LIAPVVTAATQLLAIVVAIAFFVLKTRTGGGMLGVLIVLVCIGSVYQMFTFISAIAYYKDAGILRARTIDWTPIWRLYPVGTLLFGGSVRASISSSAPDTPPSTGMTFAPAFRPDPSPPDGNQIAARLLERLRFLGVDHDRD